MLDIGPNLEAVILALIAAGATVLGSWHHIEATKLISADQERTIREVVPTLVVTHDNVVSVNRNPELKAADKGA